MNRVVRKSSGEVCVGHGEQLCRWNEHFSTVLNIRSSYQEDAISELPNDPVDESLDAPPSDDEVLEALAKLGGGGENGLLPEMWKYWQCRVAGVFDGVVQ